MPRALSITAESFPIAGSFTISRGSKTEALVVTCTIRQAGLAGRGECVPYGRYGETVESVIAQVEAVRPALEAGAGPADVASLLPPGAARNAVDCALWDLDAKTTMVPVWTRMGGAAPSPLTTAYTLSLGSPEAMAAQAASNSHRPLLKVKVGQPGDAERIEAVTAAAPNSRFILDANEGWSESNLQDMLDLSARCRVALVEQPLPAGSDAALSEVPRSVPVCADESLHTRADLARLRRRYDAINIKLDKTGGLSEAILLKQDAQKLGFQIMVGCMVGTSLAMAPALLLAQDADFVDLDGPLLLARDREPSLRYDGSLVFPPEPALWG
jgi:L-alanine-DL-glutamate epimerase-like enolase superfamily enzyme